MTIRWGSGRSASGIGVRVVFQMSGGPEYRCIASGSTRAASAVRAVPYGRFPVLSTIRLVRRARQNRTLLCMSIVDITGWWAILWANRDGTGTKVSLVMSFSERVTISGQGFLAPGNRLGSGPFTEMGPSVSRRPRASWLGLARQMGA